MERIPPQLWMRAPETLAVVAALRAGGNEVRFVGGCVRDAIVGRPVTDIDIATPDPPPRVVELLEAAGLKAVPTGIDHGTVTAVSHHRPYEITTLRRDVETDGRRAKVAFTDDWVADAARRDFTFNALSCTPDGRIYDPFGGVADLLARRVRFVGAALERIREDVLRLLRFFRFYAHYGAPPPDGEALAVFATMAPLWPTLSGERLANETLKLLAAPEPAPVLDLMRAHGVLTHFLPEAQRLDRLARLTAIEGALGLPPDPPRRLAAALAGGPAAAGALGERLRLSNALRQRLVDALDAPTPRPQAGRAAWRALRYRLKADAYRDRALIAWADSAAPVDDATRRNLLAIAEEAPATFPIRARDALDLGAPPGPAIGALMRELEHWWIAGDFRADRAACLAELSTRVEKLNHRGTETQR
jgi:poly(A) polymerase